MFTLNCKGRLLIVDKPLLMGIINVTPDSFFAGSRKEETGAVLRQAEQMLEHLQAQYRVDAVAHVENEVLAHPGHSGSEDHEHSQPDADHCQRVEGVMNNDLIDHYLGEQRRCERHQLNRERGSQDIAEDAAVLEQLGDKPAEAEFRAGRAQGVGIGERLFFGGGQ